MNCPEKLWKGFALVFLVCLIAAPSIARAQDPQPQRAKMVARAATPSLCDIEPSAHAVEDVRGKIARMRFEEDGAFTLSRTDSGLHLVGNVRDGAIRDYVIVDDEGRSVSTLTTPATAVPPDCDPCCWKCGKDEGGTVHCWLIDCPIIIKK